MINISGKQIRRKSCFSSVFGFDAFISKNGILPFCIPPNQTMVHSKPATEVKDNLWQIIKLINSHSELLTKWPDNKLCVINYHSLEAIVHSDKPTWTTKKRSWVSEWYEIKMLTIFLNNQSLCTQKYCYIVKMWNEKVRLPTMYKIDVTCIRPP